MAAVDGEQLTILDRASFNWLRERDVDLLLCAELHADGALARLFEHRLGIAEGAFAGAWVSHAEIEGESDLVLAWATSDGQAIALLENKIGAAFQPQQAARYKQRARRWASEEGVASVQTVLFAPAGYASAELAGFDTGVTYEEAAEAIAASDDGRSRFFAEALVAGVSVFRRGWVSVADEQVSNVWTAIWREASASASSLRMAKPDSKPGKSTWVYFRDANGLLVGGRRCAEIVYKAEVGRADLQFAGTAAGELEAATRGLLREGMSVVKAAKSASVRIEVPAVDFRQPANNQHAAIVAGLSACEELRSLIAEHSGTILERLKAGW